MTHAWLVPVLLLGVLSWPFSGGQSTSAPGADARSIGFYGVAGINDLKALVKVDKADLPELEKINKDFGILYRLREVNISYQEPDKFRMESRLGSYVVNGAARYIRVPQLGIRKRDTLPPEISRRYSLLDLGILTQSRAAAVTARFVRRETVGDVDAGVFDVRFDDADKDRHVLWMDPVHRLVVRRRWLGPTGAVRATFDYVHPKQVADGVWIPTRIEVRNRDGKLAGATVYSDVRINEGLADDAFAIP